MTNKHGDPHPSAGKPKSEYTPKGKTIQSKTNKFCLIHPNNIGEIHDTIENINELYKTAITNKEVAQNYEPYYILETKYTAINYLCNAIRNIHRKEINMAYAGKSNEYIEPDSDKDVEKAFEILKKLKELGGGHFDDTQSNADNINEMLFVKYYVKSTYNKEFEE